MNVRPSPVALVALVALLAAPLPSGAAAHPTPIPGGANEVAGVRGTLATTLFNGQVRIRQMKLGKPNGSAHESQTDTADTKWIAFRALMSNGTAKTLDIEQFAASLVDADGVTKPAQPDKLWPMGSIDGIPPGGAWHETVVFDVPSDFKPVKIVLVDTSSHYKAFRIDLSPSDLPQ